jgi:signal transduction histidine kinase
MLSGWQAKSSAWVGLTLCGAYLLVQEGLVRRQVAGFRDFLERISDWAMVVNVDGHVTYITKGAEQYGYTLHYGRRHWTDYIGPGQHAVVNELLLAAQAAASGVSGPACGEFALPRGDTLVFEASIYRYARGRSPRYVLTFRDVTTRKRLSEGLAQLDRYAAIAQVSSGVAHNFNNILAGIMLNAGLVAEAPVGEQRVLAERIIAGAQKGAELCRKLLRFAREESSSLGPVPIEPLLSDVVALFETEANRHAIAINWSVEPGLLLRGDRNQVHHILLNLLFNAREAIGRSGWINMKAARARDQVRIAVSNSGPPIPADQMHLIFLPFFSTKTDVVQGIGMGLAVSQGLAGGMGGHIEVDNPVGGPVCFTLVLPAAPHTSCDT